VTPVFRRSLVDAYLAELRTVGIHRVLRHLERRRRRGFALHMRSTGAREDRHVALALTWVVAGT